MKNILKLGIAGFALCIVSNLPAQTQASKEESANAEKTISAGSTEEAKALEAPQTESKQEPVKKETKSSKKEAKPAPAPAKSEKSKKSDKDPEVQKMAITEQGVNKNNNKPKAAATSTTPTPPAEEKK